MGAKKKSSKKAGAKKKSSKKRAAKKKAASKKTAGGRKKAAPKKKTATKAGAAKGEAAAGDADPPEEPEEPPEPELPPIPKMPKRRADGAISLAFAESADQAFMLFGLAHEKVDTEDRSYAFERLPLHTLHDAATAGTFDVISFAAGAYRDVMHRYLLLTCGGGFGDHRGPALVSRTPIRASEVEGLRVAVPAEHHPATLALRLWIRSENLELVSMPIAHISLMVRADKIRSGLVVNEDQVSYRRHNLVRVVDLGHWWGDRTEGLPLPTTLMGIRRDLGDELRAKIALDLKRSIAYALGHREEALDWAMTYAQKRERADVDNFVSRYVNDLSLDCGERGRQAVTVLLDDAHRLGCYPEPPHLFFS